MPRFAYVARNDAGREVKGTIEAENQPDAVGRLRQQGLAIVSLKVVLSRGGGGRAGASAGGGESLWSKLNQAPKSAKSSELAMFTRQLATMLGAGIPLLEALDILGEQTRESNKGFGSGIMELSDLVRGGSALSDAMTNYPRIFPSIYINMIKAGEASGQIDSILDRLADFLERSEALKREIKSAMTYPVVSLIMVLSITIYLLVGVVPKFEAMFASLGGELPGITKLILAASEWTQANWSTLLIATGVAFVGYKIAMKTQAGAIVMDTVKLRMPVFGGLGQKVAVSRFARTFATLLTSGVPILGALEIVATTSGNKLMEQLLLDTRDTVRSGENVSTFLETSWLFPPMVTKMIAIGERSGALEQLLLKVADFYDEQVEAMVKSLTSLIEPFMLGIMGALVGTIVLAIFLPILEMQKNLS
ncbi:MAG: type II secretion system F family protein [Planctomycetota bacterium]